MKAIFIICIVLMSCSSKNEKILYYDNGNIKEKKVLISNNDTLSYKRELYYPDGNLHFKGQILNNKTEGMLYEYSENGSILVSTLYINGLKNGIQSFYKENGILYEQNYFSNDTLMLNYKYIKTEGYLIYFIRDSKPVLIGRIAYTKEGQIDKDSSYYYNCSCKDTLLINKEYECMLEIFNLAKGKQWVEFELLDPFDAFYFGSGMKQVSESLELNFKIMPKVTGDILLRGIINVTNDTTKDGKYFPFHKEFYVKPAK